MQYLLLVWMCLPCVMGQLKLVERFNMGSLGRQVSTAARTSFSFYEEWQIFKNTHGKMFRDFDTESQRYETFKDNLQYIADHNTLYKKGVSSFYVGINQFSDMTHDEFSSYMRLERLIQRTYHGIPSHLSLPDDQLPDQIDWRTRGFVTPVKDQDSTCKYDASKVVANCTGHTDIRRGSESDLKSAVGSVGPVSVAIDASHKSFQLYKGGVYSEKRCSTTNLDHAVLAVGYGTLKGQDYWLVKNSWGSSWGEDGYVKMIRNRRNQCGIATEASYPTV
ncbi:digestive cysteine proteinase 1-like isoform X2 [Haliotis rufescens]|uniref:digestive cysteine proteinase 1-like isoform X2 n=1 Tax=Haliotis rufescens TaxID=6454 RepID=UPI001EB05D5F|nr:digestive cysteine proteinase 1-like isoform X2 [Haliotis rufescens]